MEDVETFDVSQAKKVIVFTLLSDKILKMRCYSSNIPSITDNVHETEAVPTDANMEKDKIATVLDKSIHSDPLIEVGPSTTFTIRRTYVVSEDVYKEAFKKPKVIKKEKKKVIFAYKM